MIYELVLRNFDCSLEFVFSLLLLQPFNFSPVRFACNFQDWGCVILREIDFLLKIFWSIPCLHPSWKVLTWTEICASLNHRKKTKADGSRLIPRKRTETLVLLSDLSNSFSKTSSDLKLSESKINVWLWPRLIIFDGDAWSYRASQRNTYQNHRHFSRFLMRAWNCCLTIRRYACWKVTELLGLGCSWTNIVIRSHKHFRIETIIIRI